MVPPPLPPVKALSAGPTPMAISPVLDSILITPNAAAALSSTRIGEKNVPTDGLRFTGNELTADALADVVASTLIKGMFRVIHPS